MIPDLNAVHRWNDAFSLNDIWNLDGTMKFPHVQLRRIPGIHDLPPMEMRQDPAVGRRYRDIPRSTLRVGKDMVYEGTIRARSQADLEDIVADLLEAFQEEEVGEMKITPFDGAPSFVYSARCSAASPGSELPPSRTGLGLGWERSITIGVHMSDSRFYDEASTLEIASAAGVAGGLTIPTNVPFDLAESATLPNSVSIDYDGRAPMDPVVNIVGPTIEGARLLHLEQDRTLTVGPELLAGEILEIDFNERSMVIGAVDASDYLDDANTDYWDRGVHGLVKGDNTVVLYGGLGAGMSLEWRRAYLG